MILRNYGCFILLPSYNSFFRFSSSNSWWGVRFIHTSRDIVINCLLEYLSLIINFKKTILESSCCCQLISSNHLSTIIHILTLRAVLCIFCIVASSMCQDFRVIPSKCSSVLLYMFSLVS